MIVGGYYIKARCVKNSAIAHAPPYVREIWDYLLREANHADRKYSGYLIKRGQLFRSYRDIRNDLSWKVGYRTERYNENHMKMGMRYLMKQLMITLTKQPRGNVITICNYDYFQDPKNYEATSDATSDATNGQPMGNQCVPAINKNGKKLKNEKNYKNKEKDREEFLIFYNAYPKHVDKENAFKAWCHKGKSNGRPPLDEILKILQSQIDVTWKDTPLKFIPAPTVWLNGKRWEDEIVIKSTSQSSVIDNMPVLGAEPRNELAKGGE